MKSFLAIFTLVLTSIFTSNSIARDKQITSPYEICSSNINTTVYKSLCNQFVAKNSQKKFDLSALNFCPYLNEDQATYTCLVLSSKDTFQPAAVEFCVDVNSDDARIACLSLIANRIYSKAQIESCERVSTSDAKVTCIGN